MFKYIIKCSTGCINDVKYCDSSSHIQKIKSNALKPKIKQNQNPNSKNTLPDTSIKHSLNRVRRAGASVPKKASL